MMNMRNPFRWLFSRKTHKLPTHQKVVSGHMSTVVQSAGDTHLYGSAHSIIRDIDVEFMSGHEASNIIFFLPFEPDTTYIVPIKFKISNHSEACSNKTTILARVPKFLYRADSMSRSPSEIGKRLGLGVAAENIEYEKIESVLYDAGNVNPTSSIEINDSLFIDRKTRDIKNTVTATTADGVDVDVTYSISIGYIVDITVSSENSVSVNKKYDIEFWEDFDESVEDFANGRFLEIKGFGENGGDSSIPKDGFVFVKFDEYIESTEFRDVFARLDRIASEGDEEIVKYNRELGNGSTVDDFWKMYREIRSKKVKRCSGARVTCIRRNEFLKDALDEYFHRSS